MNKVAKVIIPIAVAAAAATACTNKTTLSGIDPKAFEGEYEGKPTELYVLTNGKGMEVCVTNFGGRIVSVVVPDAQGQPKDVVLGFDSIQGYLGSDINFGAAIGRYGNRIANGRFTLDGQEYVLYQNNGTNCLHGGKVGYDRRMFDLVEKGDNYVKLGLLDPDGYESFPGNLKVVITYSIDEDNRLSLKYEGETDAPTVFNPTNHTYFNLNADGSKDILDCTLYINADLYTPTDEAQIPLGELAPVEGTVFDFTTAKALSVGLDDPADEQMKIGQGWDHNWVLNTKGDINVLAAELYSPETDIVMDVYTSEPGLQVYGGNFINGEKGKGGVNYVRRSAICLESQHYPDSPNKPEFPSTVLRPGEKFVSETIYAFSVKK